MVPRHVGEPTTALILVATAFGLLAADRPGSFTDRPKSAADLPLAFRDDFERKEGDNWEYTDPGAWRVDEVGGNHVLKQPGASRYEPQVRSPLNLALAKPAVAGDLVMD